MTWDDDRYRDDLEDPVPVCQQCGRGELVFQDIYYDDEADTAYEIHECVFCGRRVEYRAGHVQPGGEY